eukprot:TRINITY_DN2795_c1_g1_i3.p1 TRINITY_DN2795_c1_g1~~TRINITY_DN2795_c1_g1_i3.p1  ORF type:complete len:412 (-),score=145.77 TRINITY_DN2795_c1_g1_i3:239-1474(-)
MQADTRDTNNTKRDPPSDEDLSHEKSSPKRSRIKRSDGMSVANENPKESNEKEGSKARMNPTTIPTYDSNTKTDAQTRAFFSKLPSKEDKPEQRETRIRNWSSIINEYARQTNDFLVSSDKIRSHFVKDGIRPDCIPEVLMEMEQRKQLATPQQIASGTDGWGLWLLKKSYSIISSPLRYSSPQTSSSNYVVVDLLHQQSSSLLSRLDGTITTFERLKTAERNRYLSTNGERIPSNFTEQIDLCIQDLASKRQAFVFNVGKNGEKAIKISSKKENVSEVDVGTLQIKNALESVEQQIEQLEEEALLAKKQALAYKVKKQTKTALIHLQRSKRMDKLRESRLVSADNLRQILEKIEDAKTNVEVLEGIRVQHRATFGVLESVCGRYLPEGWFPTPVNRIKRLLKTRLSTDAR